jgi:hypothetical protein
MKKAQLDICIAILMDPTNQEIPSILSRIFTNQNLSDVLNSKEMDAAKEYLSSVNIKDALRFFFDADLLHIFNYILFFDF